MKGLTGWKYLLIIASAAVCSCVSPVRIVRPVSTAAHVAEPVTDVTLRFSKKYKPAGDMWHLTLDNKPVEGFTPAPIPGGDTKARLLFEERTRPYTHSLRLSTSCGFLCVYDTQTVTFTVPALRFNSTVIGDTPPVPVTQFAVAEVYVGVQSVRSVDIPVTILERLSVRSPFAKLRIGTTPMDMKAPGTPITVVIPSSSTRAVFFVDGQSLGEYELEFTAAGTVPTHGFGSVVAKR